MMLFDRNMRPEIGAHAVLCLCGSLLDRIKRVRSVTDLSQGLYKRARGFLASERQQKCTKTVWRGQKSPRSDGDSASTDSLAFIKYANHHQNGFRVRFWLQAFIFWLQALVEIYCTCVTHLLMFSLYSLCLHSLSVCLSCEIVVTKLHFNAGLWSLFGSVCLFLMSCLKSVYFTASYLYWNRSSYKINKMSLKLNIEIHIMLIRVN